MAGKVFNDVRELRKILPGVDFIATSGGFDPMHVGHLRCIQETVSLVKDASQNARSVVIVNSDGFLLRKKGFAFMPLAERMEIIAGIEGVDYVVSWDDGSQTVTGALDVLKPIIFTKGGDRDSSANVPEFDLCERINCKVLFGVGGGKIQSSSDLVAAARRHNADC